MPPVVIRLSEKDVVAVAIANLEPGATLELGEVRLTAQDAVLLGHKIAHRRIAAGEKIMTFGVPVGS